MKRRTFLKYAAGAAAAAMPWRDGLSAAAEPEAQTLAKTNADWLAQADERIEKHRKSNGVIRVLDASGKPAAGATVSIQQISHRFRFGCNFFMFGRHREESLDVAYREKFAALFNFATLGFYWAAYEPEHGRPNDDYTGRAAQWARQHGIVCKGHPLAWDHPASSPRWLPSEHDKIQELSRARVRDCIERFKDQIQIWDVVNEPTDLTRFKNKMNDWARQLGAVPFTRLHLEVARLANPKAELLVNDYRTDAAFYEILDQLRENRRPLYDAIGIQSHMHGGGWPLAKIWNVCDRFAPLQRPLHFTETTFVSGPRKGPGENWEQTTPDGEARQADYVPSFYKMLFAHPAVEALTWWDFSDAGAWQGAAAGFLRRDMSPKPVYEALLKLIKSDWWTRLKGAANDRGELTVRAFCGTHRIAAELPSGAKLTRDVEWEPHAPNIIELRPPA